MTRHRKQTTKQDWQTDFFIVCHPQLIGNICLDCYVDKDSKDVPWLHGKDCCNSLAVSVNMRYKSENKTPNRNTF